MTLIPLTSELEQAIADNLLERNGFPSWKGSTEHGYALVKAEMGGTRDIFWGYCPHCDTYFISEAIPEPVRIALLQMEHHRLSNNLTHLEAIEYALSQPSNVPRDKFIISLYVCYSEGGPLFPTDDQQTAAHYKDVEAARDHAYLLIE